MDGRNKQGCLIIAALIITLIAILAWVGLSTSDGTQANETIAKSVPG